MHLSGILTQDPFPNTMQDNDTPVPCLGGLYTCLFPPFVILSIPLSSFQLYRLFLKAAPSPLNFTPVVLGGAARFTCDSAPKPVDWLRDWHSI